jgi:hypothetical protein
MTEVAYWSLFFLPTVLRYGAHCYLQVGLGLSFSLSWNTRSLAGRGVPVNTPHTKQELAAGPVPDMQRPGGCRPVLGHQ